MILTCHFSNSNLCCHLFADYHTVLARLKFSCRIQDGSIMLSVSRCRVINMNMFGNVQTSSLVVHINCGNYIMSSFLSFILFILAGLLIGTMQTEIASHLR
jgi:hypothetical protein